VAAAPADGQGRPRPGGSPGQPAPTAHRTARGTGGAGRRRTHLHLLPWVRATWIAKGARQQVMTPGTTRRRSTFGAVDLATGRCFYQVAAKAVSATFTAFCVHLLGAYPTAPVVAVICDNVIIHRSKIVQRWLQTYPRLRILHGSAPAGTTTRLSGSGARSRPACQQPTTLTIQGRIRQVHALFCEAHPRATAGHRRAAQFPVAARRLHATP
jgi:hypothetical protein